MILGGQSLWTLAYATRGECFVSAPHLAHCRCLVSADEWTHATQGRI